MVTLWQQALQVLANGVVRAQRFAARPGVSPPDPPQGLLLLLLLLVQATILGPRRLVGA